VSLQLRLLSRILWPNKYAIKALVAISCPSLWMLIDLMAAFGDYAPWLTHSPIPRCLVTPIGRESRSHLPFGDHHLHIFCSPPSDLEDAEPQSIKRTKNKGGSGEKHLATFASVEDNNETSHIYLMDKETDTEAFVPPCQSLFGRSGKGGHCEKGEKKEKCGEPPPKYVGQVFDAFPRIVCHIFRCPSALTYFPIFWPISDFLLPIFIFVFSYPVTNAIRGI